MQEERNKHKNIEWQFNYQIKTKSATHARLDQNKMQNNIEAKINLCALT